jgi:hypothetical protein
LAVQTIRAFIPFAAGSATDILPRALFEPLNAELGQSIIVENRGGEGKRCLSKTAHFSWLTFQLRSSLGLDSPRRRKNL